MLQEKYDTICKKNYKMAAVKNKSAMKNKNKHIKLQKH